MLKLFLNNELQEDYNVVKDYVDYCFHEFKLELSSEASARLRIRPIAETQRKEGFVESISASLSHASCYLPKSVLNL